MSHPNVPQNTNFDQQKRQPLAPIAHKSSDGADATLSVGRPRVVIIGGGFGGLAAAQALAHSDAQVTVIDRNNHHLFQPLLYQVATADLSPADISAPIRSILRKQQNTRVILAEVTGV